LAFCFVLGARGNLLDVKKVDLFLVPAPTGDKILKLFGLLRVFAPAEEPGPVATLALRVLQSVGPKLVS
jgi:hypothetical protein